MELNEDDSKEKNHVYWVNSINAYHCLLVDSYRDMLDGIAIWEILKTFEKTAIPSERNLQSAIDWLGKKYGWTTLPPFLARRHAAEMIALGEFRGMRDLLDFMYQQYVSGGVSKRLSEPEEKSTVLKQEEEKKSRQHNLYTNQDRGVRERRKIVKHKRTDHYKNVSGGQLRRPPNLSRSQRSTSDVLKNQRLRRHAPPIMSKIQRHARQKQWNASTSLKIGTKTLRERSDKIRSTNNNKNTLTLSRGSIDQTTGAFRMNNMIDPTYVPKKHEEKKEMKTKKKKKTTLKHKHKSHSSVQILSPVPRPKAPSSSSTRRPVHPVRFSTHLTQDQVDIIDWIDDMNLKHWTRRTNFPNSWKIIGGAFRDGLLLCELVKHVFYVNLHPPCERPRNTIESLRNIRLALDTMRQYGVKSTWLWSAEAIERCVYPEPLFGLLRDLRESVMSFEKEKQEEKEIHEDAHRVLVRTSRQQNEKVRRVVRWIRSLGLDQELLGLPDDKDLRRTYRHHTHHSSHHDKFLNDPIRNGLLLCGIASVLCPQSALEPPYRRPRTLQECEVNLCCALQALQSVNLLESDVDVRVKSIFIHRERDG